MKPEKVHKVTTAITVLFNPSDRFIVFNNQLRSLIVTSSATNFLREGKYKTSFFNQIKLE